MRALRSLAQAISTGILLIGDCGVCAATGNIWDDFLDARSQASYSRCREQVERSSAFLSGFRPSAASPKPRYYEEYRQFLLASPNRFAAETWHDLLSNEKRLEAFLALVRQGDKYSIELAFLLFPLTDGALTEDLNDTLGMAMRSHPSEVLEFFCKYQDLIIDPRSVATGMDDELTDNLPDQLREVEARITAIEHIDIGCRDDVVEIVLRALRARGETLQRILKTREASD